MQQPNAGNIESNRYKVFVSWKSEIESERGMKVATRMTKTMKMIKKWLKKVVADCGGSRGVRRAKIAVVGGNGGMS